MKLFSVALVLHLCLAVSPQQNVSMLFQSCFCINAAHFIVTVSHMFHFPHNVTFFPSLSHKDTKSNPNNWNCQKVKHSITTEFIKFTPEHLRVIIIIFLNVAHFIVTVFHVFHFSHIVTFPICFLYGYKTNPPNWNHLSVKRPT